VFECHQAKDATILKDMLTTHLKHVPYRLGLTGTIPKEDYQSQSIISSLGQLIHHVPVKLMQEMGFIARCEVHKIVTKDTVKFKDYASEAAYLSKEPSRLQSVADAVEDIREQGNTLILVNSIEAGKELKK
jgi:superfamily II DNA or RNA helicase